MAEGGDVFVLDMGQPVKIRDLARRMINLMGLTVRDDKNPDGDIAIKYTGLRPAEKLFEELLIGNDVSGTSHPRIMRATEDFIVMDDLIPLLDELRAAALNLDRNLARDVLTRSVAEYAPSNGVEDLVFIRQQGEKPEQSDKVVNITSRLG
jgi:FlaA1/EpsC-like NDP-sugar epimerase